MRCVGGRLKCLLLIAGLLLPLTTYADWRQDFIRITCIPEARFFAFEYRPVDGTSALGAAQYDDEERKARMKLWAAQGYFDPTRLQQQCRLPDATYILETTQRHPQSHGSCGASQPIKLTLLRNGAKVFDNVTLGSACELDGPFVTSVDISEPPTGWGTPWMHICVDGSEKSFDVKPHCKVLDQQKLATGNALSSKTVEDILRER